MNGSELGLVIEGLAAGLFLREDSPGEVVFRHALTREAVYASILVSRRKLLHRAVAETLEQLYGGSLESHVADLARHHFAAEEWEKALLYSVRAGEQARAIYAPHETIDHFSRALEAAHHLPEAPYSYRLLRARGQAYETVGEFDRALADLESALEAARSAVDQKDEWQALVDLGFLWASRNYERTGGYFQMALALARRLNDPVSLGHSLNRVGNWCTNLERTEEAIQALEEALAIFEKLDDRSGLAETYDLLALSSVMACQWTKGITCYERAVAQFRELGDRPGLSSALASYAERGIPAYTEYSYVSQEPRAVVFGEAEEALQIAREITWRSGEAYALLVVGQLHIAFGEVGEGLHCIQSGLQIAREIRHSQWICLGELGLGLAYQALLELDQAEEHLRQALVLAREIGSSYFVRQCAGLLASTLVLEEAWDRAEELLREVLGNEAPNITMAYHCCLFAQAKLSLAQGNGTRALEIANHLEDFKRRLGLAADGPGTALLRGQALLRLDRTMEAVQVLQGASELAKGETLRPIQWQILAALSKAHRLNGHPEKAERAAAAARSTIAEMAAGIADEAVKRNFVQQAESQINGTAEIARAL